MFPGTSEAKLHARSNNKKPVMCFIETRYECDPTNWEHNINRIDFISLTALSDII